MRLMHIQPRIVQLGCIKIGGLSDKELLTKAARDAKLSIEDARKKGQTWSPPEKHDFFTLTTMDRDDRGRLVVDAALMSELAAKEPDSDGKLRTIPIFLLSNEVDAVLQSAFCWYGGRHLGGRADLKFVEGELVAEEITWLCDPKTGKRLDKPVTEEWRDELLDLTNSRGEPLLKVHTCLNCTIASTKTRFGGVYRFRTSSQITTGQLYGGLVNVMELTGGVLTGLPFVLKIRPQKVQPQGKTTTVYVVHIELRGADVEELQHRAERQLRFQGDMQRHRIAYKRMLTPPGHESDPAEVRDIAEEFHHVEERAPVAMPQATDEADAAVKDAQEPAGRADDIPF